MKFIRTCDYNDRLKFRQNEFLCNPISVIWELFQNINIEKEIQIDLRQNNVK
jgi:hypothetical protein